jgi:hypothetical protein
MKSPCFPDPQNFTVGSDSSIRQYTSVTGRTNFGLAWLKVDVTLVYSGSGRLFTVPAVQVGAGQQIKAIILLCTQTAAKTQILTSARGRLSIFPPLW